MNDDENKLTKSDLATNIIKLLDELIGDIRELLIRR